MLLSRIVITLIALHGLGKANAVSQSSPAPKRQWVNLARLPSPHQEHTAVAINDTTIAVVGGIAPVENSTAATGRETTDLVQFYDIPTDTWCTVAPAPYKVNHPNVAAVDGKVYLLGRLIDSNDPPGLVVNWVATGESHVYDPTTNAWSQVRSMPSGTERGSAIMGVHGEMIYVAGGMTVLRPPPDGQDAITTVISFNITSGRWQRLPSIAANIPEGRQHGAGAVMGNIFYVIGGRWFDKSNVRDSVYSLDLSNMEAGWRTNENKMPTARGGISGAAVGDQFYTFGGENNPDSWNGIFNETEVFNAKTEKWEQLPPMAIPRHGTSAVAVGNMIYLPGGGLQEDSRTVIIDGVPSNANTTDLFDAYCV